MADRLSTYRAKRDFSRTPEPKGGTSKKGGFPGFVVQKHDATRLHYDFRLEIDGVLVSWAVTKGRSLNPADKRLAVRTEDHPLDYGSFEGTIPKGAYGGGTVMLWDEGNYAVDGDAEEGLREGKLKFVLNAARLKGGFTLVLMKGKEKEKRDNWLLIKEQDEYARHAPAIGKWQRSVTSDRSMAEIAKSSRNVWTSSRSEKARAKMEAGLEAKAKPGRAASPALEKAGNPPPFAPPQLATLYEGVPEGEWIFENKFDGYRMLAPVAGDKFVCYTRSGKDWTEKFQPLADALGKLGLGCSLLDGEVVVVNAKGKSDFIALQEALKAEASEKLLYFIFDAPRLNGEDLRKRPFTERRAKLQKALKRLKAPLALADQIAGEGAEIRAAACEHGWERVIAKRPDAPYRPVRNRDWLKVKCIAGEEFVIGGWSPSSRGRAFASLLLGVRQGDKLLYRGRVGTGYDEKTLDMLSEKMKRLARKASPFIDVPREYARGAQWVSPELVAQVQYAELTASGHIRHGVFMGLREDKPAADVTGEVRMPATPKTPRKTKSASEAATASGSKPAKTRASSRDASEEVEGVRLTHPDKVLFPSMGITKRQLADYYAAMAPRILPFVKARPLSLLRCPEGEGGECFFQKHAGTYIPEQIARIPITEKKGGEKDYLLVSDAGGLVACAQMGVLELHGWGSLANKIENPDRLIFDLDPAEDVGFDRVKAAARELADVLSSAGLKSWPVVSGGKGVHIVLPLDRKADWDEVGGFAKDFADKMEELDPGRFVANMSKAKRKGRIFIDYLRNRRGATAIVPYSPRARDGAPVSMPVTWKSLGGVKAANQFSFTHALALKDDPWKDMKATKQGITRKARVSLGLA
jgi:bifunctional non-homologous end joining protein LigD